VVVSFAPVQQVLTHRNAGPIASLAALCLALALSASLVSAAQTRAEMEGRISRLSAQSQRIGAYWRARSAACESAARSLAAAAAPGAPWLARRTERAITQAAAELAGRAPEGVDACARMESADAAVLGTLK
jgi:uncharacterized protein HemX